MGGRLLLLSAPLWRPRATAPLARPPRPLRRRLFPPAPTLLSRSPPYSPGLPPGSRDRSRRRRCRPTGARGAHSGRPPLNWPLNQDCGVASGLPPLVLQLAEPELRDRAANSHTQLNNRQDRSQLLGDGSPAAALDPQRGGRPAGRVFLVKVESPSRPPLGGRGLLRPAAPAAAAPPPPPWGGGWQPYLVACADGTQTILFRLNMHR